MGTKSNTLATAIGVFATMFIFAGMVSSSERGLAVTGGNPVVYQCENGDRIVARYYSLSDGSLDFVKVTMPESREYTLPHVVSASGARYTDGHHVLWWTKGDSALAEQRDQDGNWQTLYSDCRSVAEDR